MKVQDLQIEKFSQPADSKGVQTLQDSANSSPPSLLRSVLLVFQGFNHHLVTDGKHSETDTGYGGLYAMRSTW